MALVQLAMCKGRASVILPYYRWIKARMLAALIILITICLGYREQSIGTNGTVSTDGPEQVIIWRDVLVRQEKQTLCVIGGGMGTTVISSNRSNAAAFNTYDTATIEGQEFVVQNLTFENTVGPYGNQVVAIRVEADLSAFYKCRFKGYQHTPYTLKKKGGQFFRKC